jgi:hypothetical protein
MATEEQQRDGQEGWPIVGKGAGDGRKEETAAYTLRPPPSDDITESADPSLVTLGWVRDKPCLMTVDTGAYVTVARTDIVT